MGNLKMPELNSVTLSGRLGRDPELKYTASNMPIVSLSLAFERRVKVEGGWASETSWITGTAFKETAERLATLKKGAAVVVEGSLKEERWEKDGERRSALKLIVNRFHALEWPEDGAERSGYQRGTGNGATASDYRNAAAGAREIEDTMPGEDDIPF